MTTLPPNYLRLSSKWLETNPLPEDGLLLEADDTWKPSSQRGRITATPGFDYATARTDLPREAYAESDPTPDLTQPELPKADLAQRASERAEEKCPYCGDDPVDCLACIERDRRQANETIATLRAQLDAKEAECRELRELSERRAETIAVAMHNQKVNDQDHASIVSSIRSENDKLRAEVEHRAKQRDEFQNLFIEASDGFNRRGEQLARLTAELDAVRKEWDECDNDRRQLSDDLKDAQARCGALERAAQDERRMDWIIDNCTISGGGNGFELRVFIPVDSECIRDAIDRIICADNADHERRPDSVSPIPVVKESSSATLTPSQQPDNLDSSSTEGRAERVANRRGVTMPERGSSENQSSPAVTPSRPEPVKAGEWHKPNVDDAIGGEMLGYHPEWVHEEFCPDGIRSCIHDGEMWHSSTWRDDDSNILRHSYSLAPLLVRPLPAPPTAPEGKATEGEG